MLMKDFTMAPTFKIRDPNASYIVRWPVKFKVTDTEGNIRGASFFARFKIVPVSAYNSLVMQENSLPYPDGNTRLLREVFVGFDGVGAEGSDDEISFTEEIRDQMIDDQVLLLALISAYTDCLNARKAKN